MEERIGEAVPEWANLVRLWSAPTKEDGDMTRKAGDTGRGAEHGGGEINNDCAPNHAVRANVSAGSEACDCFSSVL